MAALPFKSHAIITGLGQYIVYYISQLQNQIIKWFVHDLLIILLLFMRGFVIRSGYSVYS